MKKGYLVLENGKIFEGELFGAEKDIIAEIVFCTAMTGYNETLTDKSYYGQIIVQTFPLIGNYGKISKDFESDKISAFGYVVRERCLFPSNFRSEGDLNTFLISQNIPAICGIDTRALTKIIRENGVMNAMITDDLAKVDYQKLKDYKVCNAVQNTTCDKITTSNQKGDKKVVLWDFGKKDNILRELTKRNCQVVCMPADSTYEQIMAQNPDGIMLTNGPGDPAENTKIIEQLKKLTTSKVCIFGICLGHQLLALANGFSTEKLKYGHRGANQPVKDLTSDRVYISSQNHGYAVTTTSIDNSIATPYFVNVNDQTNEGIIYKNFNGFSVQFHPEACGGPLDTSFLFDKFISNMEVEKCL